MVSTLAAAAKAVLKRMRADWLIVAAAFSTIALATILLASGPIYADAVTISALQRSLADAPVAESSVEVSARVYPDHFDEVDSLVRSTVTGSFDETGADVYTNLEADAYELTAFSTADVTALASFQYFEGIEEKATLVSGEWPAETGAAQVAVQASAAAALGIGPGDVIEVTNRRQPELATTVVVVGTYQPDDPDDRYWFDDALSLSGQVDSSSFRTFGPFVVTQETLFTEFTPIRTNAAWRVLPPFGNLEVDEVDSLRAGVGGLQRDLDEELHATLDAGATGVGEGFMVTTGLPLLLGDVSRSLTVTRSSVLALLVQLAILAGYALVLTAGLLTDTRRTETQLTRSRGTSPRQIAAMAGLEAALLAVPAAVLAPYLVTYLLRILNVVGPLASIGLAIDPEVNSQAFALAAVAALLSIAALTWPAYRSARGFGRPVTRHRRQSTRNVTQRIGVDIALLALAAIVFWQLQTLGPEISSRVRGRFGVDPLLVIAPALALVAGAVLALRIVPLLARLAESLATSRANIAAALASWQVARRPLRYARSSLLLMLAIGIGVFAAAYSTTWIGSQRDQADYAVGADISAMPNQAPGSEISGLQLVSAQEAVPGVVETMPLTRQLGQLAGNTGLGQFIILDAARADAVVQIRDDLAPDFDSQMGQLVSGRPALPGLDLPGSPASLSMTFDAVETIPDDPGLEQCGPLPVGPETCFDARVWVVLADGDDLLHRLPAGNIPVNEGPVAVTLDLVAPSGEGETATPVYPLRVVNFELESQLAENTSRRVELALTGIEVEDIDGSEVGVAADFATWGIESTRVVGGVVEAPSITPVSASEQGLVVDIHTGSGFGTPPAYFSLRPHPSEPPVTFPVVVSSGFPDTQFVSVGDEVRLPPLRVEAAASIVGTIDGFPTVDPSLGEFVLVDLPTFQSLSYEPGFRLPAVDEYWMSIDGDAAAVTAALTAPPLSSSQVESSQELTDELVSDPVALGTIGALTIGFVAAAVFASVGFMVSATVSARERMVEFALLRALGLSPRQLASWLALEQGALVLVSLGLGTLIGVILTATILPLVSLTQAGGPAVPPVIVEYPWNAIVGLELAVVAVLGLIVAVMSLILRRVGLGSLLRLGED